MEEHFCPNCDAVLDEQSGFDSELDVWTCEECGQKLYNYDLYNGDKYPGVIWYCDECGEILNKQTGFTDNCDTWRCSHCHYENEISETEIYESETDRLNSTKENNFFDEIFNSMIEESKRIYEKKKKEADVLESIDKEERRIEIQKRKSWIRKNKKKIFSVALFLFVFLIVTICYIMFQQMIVIQYSSSELVGEKYNVVYDKLNSLGFTNIKLSNISDLNVSEKSVENIVSSVIIGNDKSFNSKKRVFSNKKIIIEYHTLENASVPISSSEIKGMQYDQVKTLFENAGFVNIKTDKIYDIITGWITSDGEIKTITINGNDDFLKGDIYPIDAKVLIRYHTLKKNK